MVMTDIDDELRCAIERYNILNPTRDDIGRWSFITVPVTLTYTTNPTSLSGLSRDLTVEDYSNGVMTAIKGVSRFAQ
ncbi:MAG: hypothetical protein KGI08_11505 [Thaumarchaeota archaeon]|nr:hypothetical protein [Nitrososphaerota archaeon]